MSRTSSSNDHVSFSPFIEETDVITRVRRISASGLRASDSTCEGIFIAEELWIVRGGLAVSVNQVISGSPCSPKAH